MPTYLPSASAVIIPTLLMLFYVGCGETGSETRTSDVSQSNESALIAIGDQRDISALTRPNATYQYEDFVEAGWKEHQIYDVSTLPHATHARYGFFNQRDIEIRIYPSHDLALEHGASSAEEAIDRTVHDGSGFASRRVYGSYLVAGNIVMLCELTVGDCVALLEAADENS